MDIHDSLTAEHEQIRALVHAIQGQRSSSAPDLEKILQDLKLLIGRHFPREEAYYRRIDKDARFSNPGLVHQLRNDHAAMIFGMESLLIRFRKKGAIAAWWEHFDKLMDMFLPHMKLEEDSLFPEAERVLTPAEWDAICQSVNGL